jgi:hypothetical protein
MVLLKSAGKKTQDASLVLSWVKTENLTLSADIKHFRKDIVSKFSYIDAEISNVLNFTTKF